MTQHFKTVCTECDKIINQCRCPSKDKVVYKKVCDECKKKFTIIIVHYNTPELLMRAIDSVPKKIPIIIVENSDSSYQIVRDPMYREWGQKLKMLSPPTQMFHGDGLHFGIQHITTPYFVAMDSDAYVKDPDIFQIMYDAFDKDTYGVGSVVTIDKNGINDWHPTFKPPGFPYLHPHFCMIDTIKYFKCKPFVHHGAPAIRAMQSIRGKYILQNIDLSEYVHHDGRGTRAITSEYKKGWK